MQFIPQSVDSEVNGIDIRLKKSHLKQRNKITYNPNLSLSVGTGRDLSLLIPCQFPADS